MTAVADPSGPLDQTPGPDANTIVGLLADADRRRLLAAIGLGATLDGARHGGRPHRPPCVEGARQTRRRRHRDRHAERFG
ncbi:MAG: hypothetical protein M3431_08380 [Actinomycetota bacterium]|nr:hypothetical protein [Actinomycetota bacterium]